MPKERISMRKIKEVLRLRFAHSLSYEKISNSVSLGQTTVREYIYRAKKAKIVWPLPADIDDKALEELLYPKRPDASAPRSMPDFEYIHKELKRKEVTLQLLWEEYIETNSDGYKYSRFCTLYKEWACKSDVWMPQHHKVGEKVFVDYAGITIPIYDSEDTSIFKAQIFVGTLGASNFTYIEATKTQRLEDWIASHQRMFTFYKGVPEVLIPDNLKSGITSPHLYEPDYNPTYLEMAEHYQIAVVPARVRKPKDKGKVEKAVLDIERQVLGKIRNQKFFSFKELNKVLHEHLKDFNNRPFQKISGCRSSLFAEIEQPVLRPLPNTFYELGYWKKETVNKGYHINVEGHYYSVPYKYVKKQVEIRYNANTVEVFFKGKQIAVHKKSLTKTEYTTNHNHRPKSHQKQAECTPEKLLQQAEKIGENTFEWVKQVLYDKCKHISQGIKICLGVLRLSRSYSEKRLEAACKRGIHFQSFTFKSIRSILENNLDNLPLSSEEKHSLSQEHDNIRGPEYFK